MQKKGTPNGVQSRDYSCAIFPTFVRSSCFSVHTDIQTNLMNLKHILKSICPLALNPVRGSFLSDFLNSAFHTGLIKFFRLRRIWSSNFLSRYRSGCQHLIIILWLFF